MIDINVGYANGFDRPENNENCPLCNNNIYVSKYGDDYSCTNTECALFKNTATNLIEKISKILNMLSEGYVENPQETINNINDLCKDTGFQLTTKSTCKDILNVIAKHKN